MRISEKYSKHPLMWVLELFSIFTAIGTFAAVYINSLVFSSWGLSYLQVASISDVVTGSIYILLMLRGALLAIVFACIFVILSSKITNIIYLSAVRMTIATIVFTIPIFIDFSTHVDRDQIFPAASIFAVIVSVSTLSYLLKIVIENGPKTLPHRIAIGIAIFFITTVMVVNFSDMVSLTVGRYIRERSAVGFLWGRFGLSKDFSNETCKIPILLWSGSQAIVYTCNRDTSPGRVNSKDVHIILAPQDVRLNTIL